MLGCEVWIPDTAIFEGGKPKLVVKTDHANGCIMRYKKMPSLMDLRKLFTVVSRERKKETSPFDEGKDAAVKAETFQQEQANRQAYLQ